FGSPDLGADVVAKNRIAAQMYGAQRAVLENHVDDRVVDVANRLHFGIGQDAADGVDSLDVSHVHTGHVEIVDAHIGDQPTADFRIAELEWGPEWVAGGGRKHYRSADDSLLDFLLCRQVPGIEPPLKCRLKEHTR